ncbi:S-methyl-5-thioribose-1-phosphate isomerase [Ammoniphilus sp. CFH 90114]|uniref:S-methyl-5-thioribose-1-phosphate isomerase n=1 Tax=Ammoniphilus sp. CFH 90114 TaxID=2493665 RepID=UPI00100FE2CE|nr:S-methyl-5-thioribose-1-phosphate isomerase [Ammoniphilus sp. CFH 90114]RXT04837.1 S-methyl-5-thioribose-1-phosphate isomerase [Ammoniphilus sp. CFH 90114]
MDNHVHSIRWEEDRVLLLDQTKLPLEVVFEDVYTIEQMWNAIRALKVRGAPAIGISAAYGMYLGARDIEAADSSDFLIKLREKREYLATSRPTAVNLFWAIDRMMNKAESLVNVDVNAMKQELLEEAKRMHEEDVEICRSIGEHAITLFHDGIGVLTHCNAGGIATAKYGTALAPMFLAKERGWDIKVFADETRPVLQGARLTAWELQQAGIDVTLICDNMAAMVMSKGWVQAVIVGTDRIAANGDVANKIGTYGLAVLAKAHGIPFYVASPLSTIDLDTLTGAEIPIEERPDEEITEISGNRVAPHNIKVFNPAFDVTPNEYVTAIITEKGIVRAPYEVSLKQLFEK